MRSEQKKILSVRSGEEKFERKKENLFFPNPGRGVAAKYNQRIAMENCVKEMNPATFGIDELDSFLH